MVSEEVKRARITAIIFGTLSSIALIASIFAFIQHGLAKRTMELAEEQAQIAEKHLAQAMQQIQQAELQSKECQKRNETLGQELIKLRNSRTK
jgi:Tfp pilus assembly protein PilE